VTYSDTIADVLDQRIADLSHDARWYKAQRNQRYWRDLRADADRERRALCRLRWVARRLAEARPDPITEAKRYDAWTQGELQEAWGR
jgi:hypothetical protein